MRKERVDVRIEPELLDELDIIAEREGLRSRSAAIRKAVTEYVLDNTDGWNSEMLKVTIPNRLAEKVQRFIMNGDARTPEEIMILALEFWTADREDYYLNRRGKLESIVAENVRTGAPKPRIVGESNVRSR